jgi:hypothetical protein
MAVWYKRKHEGHPKMHSRVCPWVININAIHSFIEQEHLNILPAFKVYAYVIKSPKESVLSSKKKFSQLEVETGRKLHSSTSEIP